MTTYTSLPAFLTDIADAIRSKTGGSSAIAAGNMPTAIRNISSASIGEATAQRTNLSSISFTGLNGEPKLFCVFLDSGSFTFTGRSIALICSYGDTTCGVSAYGGSEADLQYRTSYYSWTYSNGTLTVSCSSASSGGSFKASTTYRLVYVY